MINCIIREDFGNFTVKDEVESRLYRIFNLLRFMRLRSVVYIPAGLSAFFH